MVNHTAIYGLECASAWRESVLAVSCWSSCGLLVLSCWYPTGLLVVSWWSLHGLLVALSLWSSWSQWVVTWRKCWYLLERHKWQLVATRVLPSNSGPFACDAGPCFLVLITCFWPTTFALESDGTRRWLFDQGLLLGATIHTR